MSTDLRPAGRPPVRASLDSLPAWVQDLQRKREQHDNADPTGEQVIAWVDGLSEAEQYALSWADDQLGFFCDPTLAEWTERGFKGKPRKPQVEREDRAPLRSREDVEERASATLASARDDLRLTSTDVDLLEAIVATVHRVGVMDVFVLRNKLAAELGVPGSSLQRCIERLAAYTYIKRLAPTDKTMAKKTAKALREWRRTGNKPTVWRVLPPPGIANEPEDFVVRATGELAEGKRHQERAEGA